MAGRDRQQKQSAAQSRRAAEMASARRDRLVVIAVSVGLSLAVVIVAVGLYITQYQPPRAHAVTIGDRDYDAAAVARRGTYYALFEGGTGVDASELVDATVERLQREEALRAYGPAEVGPVTDADIDIELHERLGFGLASDADADDADATDSDATDDADSDATGDADSPDDGDSAVTGDADSTDGDATVAEIAEALVVDEAGFADALRDLLRAVGLHRDEFNDLVRSQILADRLSERFAADVADTAPQVFLRGIRVPSEGLANDLREQVIAGADFAELAAEHTRDTTTGPGGEIGWRPPELLAADVAAAIESLAPGEVSEVIAGTLFFDIYFVEERDEARALDADAKTELADARVDLWLAEQPPLAFVYGISADDDEWITNKIIGSVNDAFGQ